MLALRLFRFDLVDKLLPWCVHTLSVDRALRMRERYLSVCRSADIDPDALVRTSAGMGAGAQRTISVPTAVIRITPQFWKLAESPAAAHLTLLDNFNYVSLVRGLGLAAEVAPQFVLPGPAYCLPFAARQPQPFVVLDSHKYGTGPYVHVNPTKSGAKKIGDRGGYSGWAEINTRPQDHDFTACDPAAARAFCEAERVRVFGPHEQVSDDLRALQPYVFVALQMPCDSVQALAHVDMYDMARMCIDYFSGHGVNVVVKRHPKCVDAEMTEFMKTMARPGVFVRTDPAETLVRHAVGTATVNSTVGWLAILAGSPLLCFGEAEYGRAAYAIKGEQDLWALQTPLVSSSVQRQEQLYFYRFRHSRDNDSFLLSRLVQDRLLIS